MELTKKAVNIIEKHNAEKRITGTSIGGSSESIGQNSLALSKKVHVLNERTKNIVRPKINGIATVFNKTWNSMKSLKPSNPSDTAATEIMHGETEEDQLYNVEDNFPILMTPSFDFDNSYDIGSKEIDDVQVNIFSEKMFLRIFF